VTAESRRQTGASGLPPPSPGERSSSNRPRQAPPPSVHESKDELETKDGVEEGSQRVPAAPVSAAAAPPASSSGSTPPHHATTILSSSLLP
jgi:hypothetical protein